ncbi:MAG: dihydropteroate synthase [Desulfosudaceae bacterium]
MIIAADDLQVTNPVVARAIDQLEAGPVRALTRRCLAAGAGAIDINPGPLARNPEEKMVFLVETVQAETDLPLLLDTTNPRALSAGLEVIRNPAIINGFSLDPARLEKMLPLAAAHEADIIGYLLYPDSRVPVDENECLEVAAELFEAFRQSGINLERLLVDPVVAPLAWETGADHNQALPSVIRRLPELFGFPVRTIAGISNLTAGQPGYDKSVRLELAFLPMLAEAGLDMALLNMNHQETIRCARDCDLLLRPGVFTWESLNQPG